VGLGRGLGVYRAVERDVGHPRPLALHDSGVQRRRLDAHHVGAAVARAEHALSHGPLLRVLDSHGLHVSKDAQALDVRVALWVGVVQQGEQRAHDALRVRQVQAGCGVVNNRAVVNECERMGAARGAEGGERSSISEPRSQVLAQ
jgi:hypothetical protein